MCPTNLGPANPAPPTILVSSPSEKDIRMHHPEIRTGNGNIHDSDRSARSPRDLCDWYENESLGCGV